MWRMDSSTGSATGASSLAGAAFSIAPVSTFETGGAESRFWTLGAGMFGFGILGFGMLGSGVLGFGMSGSGVSLLIAMRRAKASPPVHFFPREKHS